MEFEMFLLHKGMSCCKLLFLACHPSQHHNGNRLCIRNYQRAEQKPWKRCIMHDTCRGQAGRLQPSLLRLMLQAAASPDRLGGKELDNLPDDSFLADDTIMVSSADKESLNLMIRDH